MDKYSLFFSLVNVHNNVLKVSVILIEVSQTHKYMVWNMKALFFLLSSLSPIIPLPLAGSSCSFRECPSWPFLPLVTFHMHYSAEWLLFVCLFVFNLVSSPRDLSCCELFLSWASLSYFTITQQMVGMVCLPFCLLCVATCRIFTPVWNAVHWLFTGPSVASLLSRTLWKTLGLWPQVASSAQRHWEAYPTSHLSPQTHIIGTLSIPSCPLTWVVHGTGSDSMVSCLVPGCVFQEHHTD